MRSVLLAVVLVAAHAQDSVPRKSPNVRRKEGTCQDKTNCFDCINAESFCGWCSPKPIIYNNGTVGTRCQDQRENNWDCDGVYSTVECQQGYICNATSGQCMHAAKGQGDTIEHCEATCQKVPRNLKVCNVKTKQCMDCQDYCDGSTPCPDGSYCQNGLCHGSTCQQAATCNASCTADTPDTLVGIWRGIEIQVGYKAGEWDLEFRKKSANAPQVTACPPVGACSSGSLDADTASQGKAFMIKFTTGPFKGRVIRGGYSFWEPSPVSETTAFFFGAPNAQAPKTITEAMAGQGSTVLEMSRCSSHRSLKCDFSSVIPSRTTRRKLEPQRDHTVDPCNVYPNCSTCTGAASNLCGWCSQPVVYVKDNSTNGARCAGFDSTGNPLGWVCTGRYFKGDCNHYTCDFSDVKNPKCKICDEDDSGCKLTKKQCDSTCKPPPETYQCDNSTGTPICKPCDVSWCTSDKDCPGSYCQIKSGTGPWICHGGQGPCSVTNKTNCKSSCTPPKPENTTKVACNYWGGQCVLHPKGTTPYVCAHECKDLSPSGTWRGIQVSTGFKRGEWDFTFYTNNTLHWRTPEGTTYQAKVVGFHPNREADAPMQLKGVIRSTRERFFGIYKINNQGNDKLIDMLFWGQGPHRLDSFHDAMDASLVLLNRCRKGTTCDFSPSIVTLDAGYHTAIAYATEYHAPGYDDI